MNKADKSLRDKKKLPFPDMRLIEVSRNTMLMDELSYDREALADEHSTLLDGLNTEQKSVYDAIIEATRF